MGRRKVFPLEQSDGVPLLCPSGRTKQNEPNPETTTGRKDHPHKMQNYPAPDSGKKLQPREERKLTKTLIEIRAHRGDRVSVGKVTMTTTSLPASERPFNRHKSPEDRRSLGGKTYNHRHSERTSTMARIRSAPEDTHEPREQSVRRTPFPTHPIGTQEKSHTPGKTTHTADQMTMG
ncbi:PDZ domain-containing protein 2 [Anopheles sinensis]|uniref:PDZ domain-containing protein 2 n=1 Tax=Anopheles sinensis TaxID=74873 RepID=A0A084VYU6_ANOSI|nr:PDZ domain-containing protein 2 [Anopheles sinensis]